MGKFFLLISQFLRKEKGPMRVWRRVGRNLGLNIEKQGTFLHLTGRVVGFPFDLRAGKREVEPSERILLREVAQTPEIPVTECRLKPTKKIPFHLRIELGGEEKWAPK